MEAFGVTKTPVRLSAWTRFKLWLEYDVPWTGIGVTVACLLFAYAVIGSLTGHIETKWGEPEKCWNWGGRSDDSFNC